MEEMDAHTAIAAQEGDNSILVSLVCNVLLVIGKCTVGVLANSNALVADGIHSLTDVIGFLLNYRACATCQLYGRIDSSRNSTTIRQEVVETESRATYYMGMGFLTMGTTICLYNFMVLGLNRAERPEFLSVVVAFMALALYIGLYKYAGDSEASVPEDCRTTGRNAQRQNKMNMVSGTAVAVGLSISMLGFSFMDEVAAIVVGSILVGMGVRAIMESKEKLARATRRHVKRTIISSLLVSVVLAGVFLAVRL